MMDSPRTLEITVISGEDLRLGSRRLVKKKAYAVIRTEDNVYRRETAVDAVGGSRPAWNERLVMELPARARCFVVEVHARDSSSKHNKMLGAARIPVTDFVGGRTPANYLHLLSYRLRDARGERNGIVNISVRVQKEEGAAVSAAAIDPALPSSSWPESFAGRRGSCGVATGIPVAWCTNPVP